MADWTEVTSEKPCEACLKEDWCCRNGTMQICRRTSHHPTLGQGVHRVDKNGEEFWLFGPPRESRFPEPTLLPSPERADADTLHAVYTKLTTLLQLRPESIKSLIGRGINPRDIELFRSRQYATLPKKGRAKIAAKLVERFGEATIARVPGFVIREHGGRRYWTIAGSPGLVIPVRDTKGSIVALKIRQAEGKPRFVYLTSASKKAGDKGASPGSPTHIPKHKTQRETIRVTEGPLKADVASLASGILTIGLSGVGAWPNAAPILRDLGAKRALIAFDADWRENPGVASKLFRLVDRLAGEFETLVEDWDPADGKGIDDVLLAERAVREIAVESDEGKELVLQITEAGNGATEAARVQERKPTDGRAEIEVTPDEHVVIDQTITALVHDPTIYKRAGTLVHIVREKIDTDDDGIRRTAGTPRIREVSTGLLRERLSADCYFYKTQETENGVQRIQTPPPVFAVQSIHTRGFWEPLRMLTGIVETPVLRPDGTILDSVGWDEQTGLLYEPGDIIPEVRENPSQADAMAACEVLLDLVADFPFSAETHRASWLAGLLTVLARRAFSGPAPLFLIDANVRGSGKSLLTDVIAIITTGRAMPRLSNPGDDDEARKRITSLAIAGDPLVLVDNISSTLGSASLDAALTSTVWKDRLLGVNKIVECGLRAVWFGTGNNVILKADTSRRVCHVRLDSREESPEERTGFKYPNLVHHVRDKRLELLTAGLTILRAFVVAGQPDAGLKPWGSFEGWSGLIRNCIAWLDLPDPGETRRELAEASDRDAAGLRALFSGWKDVDPTLDGLTAAALVKLLDGNQDRYGTVRDALAELCDSAKGLTARRVGNQLRRFRGRVVGNQRIDYRDGRGRQRFWIVETINGDSGDSGDSVFHPLAREVETPIQLDGQTDGIISEPEKESPESPQSPVVCSRCEDVIGSSGQCPTCGDW